MKNKKIYAIDIIIIITTCLVLLFLVGYSTHMVISPINTKNLSTSESLFTIHNTQTLLIDNNLNFTNPKIYKLKNNLQITLEPGTHYLKFIRPSYNQINTLNVKKQITLEFKKQDNAYNIINSGKEPLIIEIYDQKNTLEKKRLLPKYQIKSTREKK